MFHEIRDAKAMPLCHSAEGSTISKDMAYVAYLPHQKIKIIFKNIFIFIFSVAKYLSVVITVISAVLLYIIVLVRDVGQVYL